jgi:hypothetical protein
MEFKDYFKNEKKKGKQFKIVYVEEYFKIKNPIVENLSTPHKNYCFKVVTKTYNSEVISELIRRQDVSLIILDVDQLWDNFPQIVSQIRAFCWHMPIVFASADKERAARVLSTIYEADTKYQKAFRTKKLEENEKNQDFVRIGGYLIPMSIFTNSELKLKHLLYPTVNNLIYQAWDKFSLVTSVATSKLYRLVRNANLVKRQVDEVLNKERKNKDDKNKGKG